MTTTYQRIKKPAQLINGESYWAIPNLETEPMRFAIVRVIHGGVVLAGTVERCRGWLLGFRRVAM